MSKGKWLTYNLQAKVTANKIKLKTYAGQTVFNRFSKASHKEFAFRADALISTSVQQYNPHYPQEGSLK